MPYKLIIFDFDGTIADTLEEGRQILNQLAEYYKFQPLEQQDLQKAKGMTLSEFIRFLEIPKRKVPRILSKGKRMLRANIRNVQVNPGMEQTLYRLKDDGWMMGILTSNTKENVDLFLRSHGLKVFEFVSSVRKLTGKHKHLRAILKTFSLHPGQALYIGDETRDVKASNRVNMPIAACTWGFNNRQALEAFNPTFIVDEPHELMEIIYEEEATEVAP
jgi:phosphoglycolate phosphatase